MTVTMTTTLKEMSVCVVVRLYSKFIFQSVDWPTSLSPVSSSFCLTSMLQSWVTHGHVNTHLIYFIPNIVRSTFEVPFIYIIGPCRAPLSRGGSAAC